MTAKTAVPAMTEQQLQDSILELCGHLRLKAMHINRAQLGGKWLTAVNPDGVGYPDLTIAGPRGVIFAELKDAKGTVSPEQKAWLAALEHAAGPCVVVWRPADWRDHNIQRHLALLARKRVPA